MSYEELEIVFISNGARYEEIELEVQDEEQEHGIEYDRSDPEH